MNDVGLLEHKHCDTLTDGKITDMRNRRLMHPGYAGQKDDSRPRQNGAGWHDTQNNKQFKAYKLFISGIFQLIFLDHD